ncbi:MAG: PDZ domain-containing protein [Acidobacteriota bacterium]
MGAQQTAASPNNGSYLGIWVWELDASRAKELKVPDGSGVVVTLVSPGSPADQAGVKTGDVISEFNGQKVDGIEQFSRFVRDTPAGRAAKLKIIRNGSTQVLNAKIGAISAAERPGPVMIPPGVRGDGSFPSPERQDVPRSLTTWRSPVLGVDAEPLFGQLAAYFGVSEGVLVRGVAAGSPAEKAGLKAGDVITHVGKHTVNNPAGITAELRMASSSTVKLGVTRDRNPLSLSVTLE